MDPAAPFASFLLIAGITAIIVAAIVSGKNEDKIAQANWDRYEAEDKLRKLRQEMEKE